MGILKPLPTKVQEWAQKRAEAIWTNLRTNHLWQRMLKNTLATTITVILALLPAVVQVYGKAAYLGPITTVFGHPGRRFGMMAEALALALCGTFLGIGWSMFGLYLSSLVYDTNSPAAYTIRGLFLAIALIFHGFLRSHTPRLFIFVLLLVIVTVVSLTSVATEVSKTAVTQLLYPILTAAGVSLLINICVFPEFSSSFLGITTIETLGDTVGALRDAGKYFTAMVERSREEAGELKEDSTHPGIGNNEATAAEKLEEKSKENATPSLMHHFLRMLSKSDETKDKAAEVPMTVKLKSLTDVKTKLRAKLASCKAAQQECNFELAWAVLPPQDLKPISDTNMKLLVANTIALIGACESKYALMGDGDNMNEDGSEGQHKVEDDAEIVDHDSEEGSSHPKTPMDDLQHDSDNKRRFRKERKEQKRRKKSRNRSKTPSLEKEKRDLELVKPRKEIEFGDVELLKYLVDRVAKPLSDLQEKIDRSVDVITSCLAYCYDVPKLPSGAWPPTGIELQEIDIRVDILTEAISAFDKDSVSALEKGAQLHDIEHPQMDIMPRMETFLISSFLLNLRQAALHTLEMLRHSRSLVEKRQARHGRHRIYAPRISWGKWLRSGGEEDMLALPESGRKEARSGNKNEEANDEDSSTTSKESLLTKKDIESGATTDNRCPQSAVHTNQATKRKKAAGNVSLIQRFRNGLADAIEYLVGSEDVSYALKLTVAVFLVTWPAFLHQWNAWYSLNRGLWAALQLVLITEVALGTSIMTFLLRAVGTTIGCVWGYVAYQAGHGNRVVCVVILILGIIPSTYIQLGSKYVKAGMVSIVSMCIVALATVDHTVPGSATENFLKRLIAFLIGGVVALIVELVLFPVKARDRLVESLAASIRQISEMEGCIAYGIETEINVDVHSKAVSERFSIAKSKAEGALAAAEMFLPFCVNEPRLKGSFKGLSLVYAEILYVLHAIVDRMDNVLHLRQDYGSDVLKEFNSQVYPYRRNVAGSVTLVLFAVHEALTTKLPLPQFLPSARLAHLRMINRVREVILANMSVDRQPSAGSLRSEIEMKIAKRVVKQKFLSWNAASAGQMEVIEYLEELIDLTKLLVGANEFRSGMLTRPTYRGYVDRIDPEDAVMERAEQLRNDGVSNNSQKDDEQDELRDQVPDTDEEARKIGLTRRRTAMSKKEGLEKKISKQTLKTELERRKQAEEEELPKSLQRVRSRRVEEMTTRLEKSKSKDAREGKRVDR
ncbi:hypothetical protein D0Z07_4427 [Hyphodiscus hymeniophilus]|uniref:ER transporter 6TM N-terminal domain-containing protein n=1 Tax=Hyphodiscus hymeniophilus TaxID=353542 RepID=A0A9P7AXL9_9HELO|nr:hypothetical protein D0Z07_4427 [Hyphodiscus hymeniophilus]